MPATPPLKEVLQWLLGSRGASLVIGQAKEEQQQRQTSTKTLRGNHVMTWRTHLP